MPISEILEEIIDLYSEKVADAEADDDDEQAEHFAMIVEALEGLLTEANAAELNEYGEL